MPCTREISIAYVVALVACGGATAQDKSPPPFASAPATNASASAPVVIDAGPPLPPEPTNIASIDAPSTSACAFEEASITSEYSIRPKPGTPAIATLGSGGATVKLLPTGGLFVQATTGSMRVAGYVDPGDARVLHTSRAITFGGFAVSLRNATVSVASSGQGKLVATLANVDGVTPASSQAPSAEVTCADLAIDLASYQDAHATLPPPKRTPVVWLLPDKDVALSATAGGAVVARLHLEGTEVDIVEQGAGRFRIAVDVGDRMIFGWVAANALRAVTRAQFEREQLESMKISVLAALGGGGTSALAGASTAAPPIDELRCPSELRVIAESQGARWFVGTATAASVVRVIARDETLTKVSLPTSTRGDFAAASTTTLFVPTRDLATCASQPVTTDPPPAPPSSPSLRLNLPPGTGPAPPGSAPPRSGDPTTQPGPRGAVSLGATTSTVPMRNLDSVLRGQLMPRARACYNKGLAADPTMEGRMVVIIIVGPDGFVTGTSISANSGLSPSVASCVAGATRNLRFEPIDGGSSSTVRVPIAFARQPP